MADEEAKKEEKTKEKEEHTIFVGTKPPMSYVLAIVTEFKKEDTTSEVTIKARGRAISRAVDAAEIARNRFVTDTEVKDIKIDTESVTNDEGDTHNVSSIEITLAIKK